ncbi:ankyrin repeat-containing protein [Plakobranchus ocellatus]|uniref:Ankyrin repeat-containing protein n=1 Tax=Plakobranchus ocellatus TaxID=259542 RepID=A0AAV4DHC4_9GAST|nr:ankyrin repeat-containing protein [Plakobranchus ocellatus]
MANSSARSNSSRGTQRSGRSSQTTQLSLTGEKEAFITATEQGDAEKVRRILEEHKIGPNTTVNREGFGANMIAEDHKGRQPAHLAATRNHVKILRMLFDHGVDLDCQCEAGKTPLHYGAQHGGQCWLCSFVKAT